jgi:hypothetical protein
LGSLVWRSGVFEVRLSSFLLLRAREEENEMSEFHGNLLIGGMRLKNLSGTLDEIETGQGGGWRGELFIEPRQNEYLQPDRPYRLELDDGRAGTIAITRIGYVVGEPQLQAAFDGLSPLAGVPAASERSEPVHASG